MNWSEEQVLALSPDDSSTKAGKDLAKPDKWLTLAFDDKALWGEIKGSGSNPYRTQIDKRNTAFKCSCPSRKFPCKHGLGLFLIFARAPE
ncbi:MAG TPA: SWIM zinc finger family protein, partial [Cytophagales bacterium]|nr:SWIM zinc finger family protein [Cytophagales bacterium]